MALSDHEQTWPHPHVLRLVVAGVLSLGNSDKDGTKTASSGLVSRFLRLLIATLLAWDMVRVKSGG